MLPLIVVAASAAASAVDVDERTPAWAGQFYPAPSGLLERAIRAYLADAVPAREPRPAVLVVPHAGYVYSGQIAADAWRQVQGRSYDLVVILGTDHSGLARNHAAITPAGGFRTPLGVASVDRTAAEALAASDPVFTLDAAPHAREHSVEVQVPFAQVALPGTRILPVVVGAADPDLPARVGRALGRVLKGRQALVVASSDLAHYPAYDDAVAADRASLEAIASLDPAAFRAVIAREATRGRANLVTSACGEAPVVAAMEAARALGAGRGVVLSYANSGDTAIGERSRVVGYGAVALVEGTGSDTTALARPTAGPDGAPLAAEEEKALLRIARESIRRLSETQTAPLVRGVSPALLRRQAVFVTLRKHGVLRGCIGTTTAALPLGQAVGAMALQAAFSDRRFAPVEPGEVDALRIEVSLLSAPERVERPAAIVVGRDGVVLRKEGRSALFLPEVAAEQGWDRDRLLTELSFKAGLPGDAWRKGGELLTFRTVVVREPE